MTKTRNKILGDAGEDAASNFLRKNKFKILERNYAVGNQEIDIIAENKEFLVFAEVKTRTFSAEHIEKFGHACEAVDHAKRRNLLAAARRYISTINLRKKIRMDVIEVYFSNTNPPHLLSIHHMPDAFRIE